MSWLFPYWYIQQHFSPPTPSEACSGNDTYTMQGSPSFPSRLDNNSMSWLFPYWYILSSSQQHFSPPTPSEACSGNDTYTMQGSPSFPSRLDNNSSHGFSPTVFLTTTFLSPYSLWPLPRHALAMTPTPCRALPLSPLGYTTIACHGFSPTGIYCLPHNNISLPLLHLAICNTDSCSGNDTYTMQGSPSFPSRLYNNSMSWLFPYWYILSSSQQHFSPPTPSEACSGNDTYTMQGSPFFPSRLYNNSSRGFSPTGIYCLSHNNISLPLLPLAITEACSGNDTYTRAPPSFPPRLRIACHGIHCPSHNNIYIKSLPLSPLGYTRIEGNKNKGSPPTDKFTINRNDKHLHVHSVYLHVHVHVCY